MKRKNIVWILLILVFGGLIFFYEHKNAKVSLPVDEGIVKPIDSKVSHITIHKGPLVKVVSNGSDVDNVIKFINSIDYGMNSKYGFKETQNWIFLLRIYKEDNKHRDIVFTENVVQYINGGIYTFDNNTIEELTKLYNSLEYEEVHFTKLVN